MKRRIVTVAICLAFCAQADVRLWVSNGNTDGDLATGNPSARAGANALCAGDVNRPTIAGTTSTIAFISIDASDEIRDIPTNYPALSTTTAIKNKDGTATIANNFAALLNTTYGATNPLLNPISSTYLEVFTGSEADGSLSSGENCSNFTVTTGVRSAANAQATSSNYLNFGNSSCNITMRLYCLTFTTTAPASSSVDITEWEEEEE